MGSEKNPVFTYWNDVWNLYTKQQRMKLLMEFDEDVASFLVDSVISKSSYDAYEEHESVITMTSGEHEIHLVLTKSALEYWIDDTNCPFEHTHEKVRLIVSFIMFGVDLHKISNQIHYSNDSAFLAFLNWSGTDLRDIKTISKSKFIVVEMTDGKSYYIMSPQERTDYAFNECRYMHHQLMVQSQAELENMHETSVNVSWVSKLTGLKKNQLVEGKATTMPSSQAAKFILDHCSELLHFEYFLKNEGWGGIINEKKFPEVFVDDCYYIYQMR